MSLLRYENLSISFGSGRREKFAVNHLDLDIGIGERVALVGESGSGKTLTALAPLRLEPEGAKVSGKILWNRKDGQEQSTYFRCQFKIFVKFVAEILLWCFRSR
jgi:microcin C transport system ATP-binding protein